MASSTFSSKPHSFKPSAPAQAFLAHTTSFNSTILSICDFIYLSPLPSPLSPLPSPPPPHLLPPSPPTPTPPTPHKHPATPTEPTSTIRELHEYGQHRFLAELFFRLRCWSRWEGVEGQGFKLGL